MSAVQAKAEMNCRACRYRVEKALKGVDGVRTFGVDLRRGLVTVGFDEKMVSAAALRRVVEQAVNRDPFSAPDSAGADSQGRSDA